MERIEDLVKKDKYQVFILSCPAYLPFSFARHPWFVLNNNGILSRWEIRHCKNKKNNNYLFFNVQPPFQGTNITFFVKRYFWKAKLVGFKEGDDNSVAKKIIEFVENSENNYPYCSRYSFWGPNSNTFIQWVLNKFPEFKIKLSWKYIGKEFKI